jgi:hypothetical protein
MDKVQRGKVIAHLRLLKTVSVPAILEFKEWLPEASASSRTLTAGETKLFQEVLHLVEQGPPNWTPDEVRANPGAILRALDLCISMVETMEACDV